MITQAEAQRWIELDRQVGGHWSRHERISGDRIVQSYRDTVDEWNKILCKFRHYFDGPEVELTEFVLSIANMTDEQFILWKLGQ